MAAHPDGVAEHPSLLVPRLLPFVFEGIDTSRPLTVLDIGAGVPESVRFFNGFRCRIHFVDLFGDTGYTTVQRERRRPRETLFGRFLDFPPGTSFDICLFWDFLNYLANPLLRDFAQTLRGYVHDDTRGHAFAAFSNALPFTGLRFGLADADRLTTRPHPDVVPHPHTRKHIADALWPFAVKRAALLEENRQELLLEIRRI